jgi:hypothetical protein
MRRACAAPFGAGGRGSASPLQGGRPIPGRAFGCDGWGAHARPVGVRRCLTRPARRAGMSTRMPVGGRLRSSPRAGVCRGWLRPWRGRARRRLAPTTWRGPSLVGHMGATVGRWPRHVGVRRCLTRRPGRAGNDTADARRRSVAIIAASWSATCMCRAGGAGGRGSASPLQRGGTFQVGRVSARAGATGPALVGVRRCLTRPAQRAGNHAVTASRCGMAITACGSVPGVPAPSGAGGRGAASPLQGGPIHPRSGIGVRRLGTTPVCRGQAVPDPSGPEGRQRMPMGAAVR